MKETLNTVINIGARYILFLKNRYLKKAYLGPGGSFGFYRVSDRKYECMYANVKLCTHLSSSMDIGVTLLWNREAYSGSVLCEGPLMVSAPDLSHGVVWSPKIIVDPGIPHVKLRKNPIRNDHTGPTKLSLNWCSTLPVPLGRPARQKLDHKRRFTIVVFVLILY